jgi:hypothetical protein
MNATENLKSAYGIRVIEFGESPTTEVVDRYNSHFFLSKLDFIPYGEDNLAPDKFIVKLQTSPHYSRIMNTLANMIRGAGFIYDGADKVMVENHFRRIGVDEKFLEKASWDAALLNAFSCQVILDATSKLPARIAHQRVSQVRVGRPDEFDDINYYYLARDWKKIGTNGKLLVSTIPKEDRVTYEPIRIEKYGGRQHIRSLIYNPKYSPARFYYPLPESESSLKVISLSEKILEFQESAIRNGVFSSVIINYPKKQNADWDKEMEEQKLISDSIKKGLAGAKNAGKAAVIFYDPQADKGPEIKDAPSDENDKKYIETNRLINENMMTGLGVVSGELFGVPSSGGFSSQADMLLVANELTHTNVACPLQNLITEPLNQIIRDAGISARIDIATSVPVSQRITESMVTAGIVTKNEFRKEILGLKPLTVEPQIQPQPVV